MPIFIGASFITIDAEWTIPGIRTNLLPRNIKEIDYIIVTGDELEEILRIYSPINKPFTIPVAFKAYSHNTMTWYGDIAKTIIANL